MGKHIIAVCGAGGKTTLCKSLAKHYAEENKKVCILTTTHMWHDFDVSDINKINRLRTGYVYYFGRLDGEKVAFVNDEDYKFICKKFDYVIIEADGSKSMPMKIPAYDREPVLPKNVSEIIIVSGKQAIGREIGAACQRFYDYIDNDKFLKKKKIKASTIVTEKLLHDFVNHYYVEYLKEKHKKAKISTCFVDMTKLQNYKNIHKVALSLCASGASKRFGVENKLLTKIKGIELYKLMTDKLLKARELVKAKFKKELSYNDIDIDISIVSKYDEILNDSHYINKVRMIKNDNADVGLSNSIKLTVNEFNDYDAIMFLNADLPNLPVKEIVNFLYNSICSNTGIAAMFTDMPKNPAYFEKMYFDEMLDITGDIGPKELLNKYKKHTYKYHISDKYLMDIDTKDDLRKIREN